MRFDRGPIAACVFSVVFVSLFAISGCGSAEKETGKTIPRQEGTELGRHQAADFEALIDSVMARARRRDTVGLVNLMVDDSVYKAFIYPRSEAYDSTRPDVFAFVLGFHKLNTVKGLKGVLFDASEAPATRPVGEYQKIRIEGGFLYEVKPLEPGTVGIRPFGSAVCLSFGCQVVSFSSAGLAGSAAVP